MSDTSGEAIATITRNDLAGALAFAQLGLSKRPVAPVLAGMLVTVSADMIELAAFDYETAARALAPCETAGEARMLVSGAELANVVKALPAGKDVTAEIEIRGDSLTLTCDDTEFYVSSLPVGEYPQLPDMPGEAGVIDGATFVRSALRAATYAGTDDTLPVLTCVSMTSDGGELEFAATDRYRLGVDRLHWTGPDGIAALVPARTLTAFAKKAGKSGKISVHAGGEFAGFSDGAYSLVTRTCGGEFPKFRQHIRSEHETVITADAGKVAAAVKRAGLVGGRNSRTGFDVTAAGVKITSAIDGRLASSQVVAAEVAGGEMDYGFNAGYLMSALAGFDGDVQIGLKVDARTETRFDGSKIDVTAELPAVLTADGDTFTAVCMPIRKAN